jgi:hypothetical protein
MRHNIKKYTHRSTGETCLVCAFEGYYDNEELAYILPNGKIITETKFKELFEKTEHET